MVKTPFSCGGSIHTYTNKRHAVAAVAARHIKLIMKMKWLMVSCLVFLVAACQAPITNSLLNHFTEHVINNLNNSSTLEAHCKSKDDDLGLRQLAAGRV